MELIENTNTKYIILENTNGDTYVLEPGEKAEVEIDKETGLFTNIKKVGPRKPAAKVYSFLFKVV